MAELPLVAMPLKARFATIFLLAGLVACHVGGQHANAGFTAGSLVVSVFGDGATTTGNKPITLREYTASGSSTGFSVALPAVDSGPNRAILGATSNTGIGFLKQSVDQNYLSIIAYGTSNQLLTIARIDQTGAVDSSTSFSIAGGGGPTPRSAITTNGIDFWWSASAGSNNFAGVRYLTLGGTTTGVAVGNAANGSAPNAQGQYPVPLNMRVVGVFGNQLYGSAYTPMSPSGTVPVSFRGVFTIGVGIPTTGQQYGTMLAGGGTANSGATDGPWEFYVANDSTIYVADDDTSAPASGGLQKWVKDTVSGSWSKVWSVIPDGSVGMRGLTGLVTGSSVQLYGITAMTSSTDANSLVALSDTLEGTLAPSFTTLATAETNYVFRGVAFTPVPEPAALALALGGLVTVAGFMRRLAGRRSR